jgi:hypothetical protein
MCLFDQHIDIHPHEVRTHYISLTDTKLIRPNLQCLLATQTAGPPPQCASKLVILPIIFCPFTEQVTVRAGKVRILKLN